MSACETAPPLLHHVAAGGGETVLLLHGSASTSAFWRRLIEALQPLYRVIAPDLIGYGQSSLRPADAPHGLEAEIRTLKSLLPCCDGGYHLAGHSYGGVVALMLALSAPTRVRTLTLIEPVFFAALRHRGDEASFRDFQAVRDRFVSMVGRGAAETALRDFVGFWTGAASWERMPAEMRGAMLQNAGRITRDWQASFAANADSRDLAALGPRTLLLAGVGSPAPMLRLVEALHRLMPGSRREIVPRAGHLLPITHVSAVSRAVLDHLDAAAKRRSAGE